MSMALADIDGDGDLDLYVANYRTTTVRSTGLDVVVVDDKRMLRPEDRGAYDITPEGFLREHGEADIVYRNDGKGNFTQLSWIDGTFLDDLGKPLSAPPRDWGYSIMFRDLNGDHAPDMYICNDFWSPDRIWINDGQGRFRAAPRTAFLSTSSFSMGLDFADVNRDGFMATSTKAGASISWRLVTTRDWTSSFPSGTGTTCRAVSRSCSNISQPINPMAGRVLTTFLASG